MRYYLGLSGNWNLRGSILNSLRCIPYLENMHVHVNFLLTTILYHRFISLRTIFTIKLNIHVLEFQAKINQPRNGLNHEAFDPSRHRPVNSQYPFYKIYLYYYKFLLYFIPSFIYYYQRTYWSLEISAEYG